MFVIKHQWNRLMPSHSGSSQSGRPDLTTDQMRRRIARIERCLGELGQFDPAKVEKRKPPEVLALETSIEEALIAAFGDGTAAFKRYSRAAKLNHGSYAGIARMYFNDPAKAELEERSSNRRFFSEGKAQSIEQAIRTLEDQIADQEHNATLAPTAIAIPASEPRKIFIVHGHDSTSKAEVARYIEKLGFEAIILHERANKGRTLITKFREEANDAGFAIVLMTPDDLGKAEKAVDFNLRARENVVFELGFFVGKLGPERVAALVKGSIERPSDFDGVVYIALEEDWQKQLGIELQEPGYEIDWNKVMRG
jgi:predicted nucleotide-binding protein